MGRNVIIRCGIAIALTSSWITFAASAAVAQEGSLTVSPERGPVGTRVTLVANGCADPEPGQNTVVSFQGGGVGGAIIGGDEVAVITADSPDPVELTYSIPAELDPIMNEGGKTTPGIYFFRSYPPGCTADFTVTGGLAATGSQAIPLIAAAGALLLVAGIAVRVVSG